MAVCYLLSRQSTSALRLSRTPAGAWVLKLSSALTSNLRSHRQISSFGLVRPVAAVQLRTVQLRCLATQKDIKEEDPNNKAHHGVPDPGHLEHFKDSRERQKKEAAIVKEVLAAEPPIGEITLPHPIWSEEQLHSVKITHTEPQCFVDKFAYITVKMLRTGFDVFSGFKWGQRTEHKWLKRIIFLETVAGVPGMVAAMMRHMTSLRRLQRDHGWIHTLLEEAENERMHLMTALQLKKPSLLFRSTVILSQGMFVTLFSIWYMFSPKFCHRFVGYLEEEAVKTYTKCLEDIASGSIQHWNTQPAPDVAIRYWKLAKGATMRDVILAIRADEAHHRVVNHNLASLKKDQFNPFKPGQ